MALPTTAGLHRGHSHQCLVHKRHIHRRPHSQASTKDEGARLRTSRSPHSSICDKLANSLSVARYAVVHKLPPLGAETNNRAALNTRIYGRSDHIRSFVSCGTCDRWVN